jgi:hypothetical protein
LTANSGLSSIDVTDEDHRDRLSRFINLGDFRGGNDLHILSLDLLLFFLSLHFLLIGLHSYNLSSLGFSISLLFGSSYFIGCFTTLLASDLGSTET